MTLITPTTELEAVNAMLALVGEAPVNTLNQPGLADAVTATTILSNVSREVQARGWAFNREYEFPITPDINGFILIPTNTAQISVADSQKQTWDLQWRGTKMYDRLNRTYVIGQTVKFNITILLTFEDMPQAARQYIFTRAARKFLDATVGNESLHGYAASDELTDLSILQDAEGETEDFNILFDNYSVFRTLDRGAVTFDTIIVQ